ncbi:MAG: YhbD family protein [Peptococcaceae bacterium]|nr:YhbD family protein [Peptococcaceae bacterium]
MEDLISKKELLELTGISYGALYRYKRKALIPDEWFIRKSTFTGQETFFPRELILRRIEQIQQLKEEVSLDDMHDMLSGDIPETLTLTHQEFMPHISVPLAIASKQYVAENVLGFKELLALITADAAMKSGKTALAECEQILQTLLSVRTPNPGDRLLGYRSSGVFFCMVAAGEVWIGADVLKVIEIDLAERISALKVFVRDKKGDEDSVDTIGIVENNSIDQNINTKKGGDHS